MSTYLFAGDEDSSPTCLLVVVFSQMCNGNSAASSYCCVDTCRSTLGRMASFHFFFWKYDQRVYDCMVIFGIALP
jgi:hypothetical protein